MIRGILFDKDGTLIEFETMWHKIMALVFSQVEAIWGYDERTMHELMKLSGYQESGFSKESAIQYMSTREIIELWTDYLKADDKEVKNRFLHIFSDASMNDDIPIRTREGVLESLYYLKRKGYLLGVATADLPESTRNSLKRAGILDYFDFIGADDGIMKAKPDPDMAFRFCRQVNLAKEELLVVGDSVSDYCFAKRSGAGFAGIRSSYGTLDDSPKKDFILVDSLETLMKEMGL